MHELDKTHAVGEIYKNAQLIWGTTLAVGANVCSHEDNGELS